MLTPREQEVYEDLRDSGLDWCRPMDIGGRDGSDHSNVLTRLVRKGVVDRRSRGALNGATRGSYVYRVLPR